MYPTDNKVYVPDFPDKPRDVTIEEARAGRVVALSEDGSRATVEVKIGTAICYCGVIMNPDGTVKDFVPRVNRDSKVSPAPDQQGSFNPSEHKS